MDQPERLDITQDDEVEQQVTNPNQYDKIRNTTETKVVEKEKDIEVSDKELMSSDKEPDYKQQQEIRKRNNDTQDDDEDYDLNDRADEVIL